MRKFGFSLIASVIIGIMAGLTTSCGNDSSKAQQDSIARADSIAAVRAIQDSIRRDSILSIQIANEYANPLNVKFGKKVEKSLQYYEGMSVTIPVTVTNITAIPLKASDYSINYIVHYRRCSDYSEPDDLVLQQLEGKDLNPGETVQLFIKDDCCDGITNPSFKFNLSKEEFERRYREYASGKKLPESSPSVKTTGMTAALAGNLPTGGEISQFEWLSQRQLTPDDLKRLTPSQMRILRNAIYAMHGYIFKSADLKDYFENFIGYAPYTTNINDLNPIEEANIALFKYYE